MTGITPRVYYCFLKKIAFVKNQKLPKNWFKNFSEGSRDCTSDWRDAPQRELPKNYFKNFFEGSRDSTRDWRGAPQRELLLSAVRKKVAIVICRLPLLLLSAAVVFRDPEPGAGEMLVRPQDNTTIGKKKFADIAPINFKMAKLKKK